MKKIQLEQYNKSMGTLIDLSSPQDYLYNHPMDAINIPYQKFMLYYDKYLKKENPYYFICRKGVHSRRVVTMLEYFGYDVTQVLYS